jgi:hypothetical protein
VEAWCRVPIRREPLEEPTGDGRGEERIAARDDLDRADEVLGSASLSRNPTRRAKRLTTYSSRSNVVRMTTLTGSAASDPASTRVASMPSRTGIRMVHEHDVRSRATGEVDDLAAVGRLARPPRGPARPSG